MYVEKHVQFLYVVNLRRYISCLELKWRVEVSYPKLSLGRWDSSVFNEVEVY